VSIRALLLSTAILAALGCGGEPTEPSPAEGTWQFDASYSGNGYSCSIVAAILTLQQKTGGWTGTLTGGQAQCLPPPGNPTTPPAALNEALDQITVHGDSVAFALADEPFAARGTVTTGQMGGTVEAATPFCQCTDPSLHGTWTGIRP
jgi:hypothetical protein